MTRFKDEDYDRAEADAERRATEPQCEACDEPINADEEQEDGMHAECAIEDREERRGFERDDYFGDFDDDRSMFADPGGNSALRAATASNPRNLPCPSCHAPNRLTPADRARGYQCDTCADAAERGW